MSDEVEFVALEFDGRRVSIEYQWIGDAAGHAPLLVFLHEGLGSRAMWKDFPARLCARCGFRGLVYSRPGYGRSTPRAPDERWGVDFMHRQAHALLPALFAELGVDSGVTPPWLIGHSDGGSIALLYAARYPAAVAGLIVLSPHIMVEDLSIASIEKARDAWRDTDLGQRLARYHDNPDSAFRGWNEIWLDPAFRAWSIEAELEAIECPVLALQGIDDEYGTLAQVHGIAARVPTARVVEIPDCGHSPQRDQPARLLDEVVDFVGANRARVVGAE
ncbi:MAG: alpha/beta hydrolase [Gammaproteobacteria bacterium]|nr:alpha/beta hydrolase [Gammaproteobacteria bacterium]